VAASAFDASDRDGGWHINMWPDTYGMFMPDAIEYFRQNGNDYLVTANEGDSKDWLPFFSEETRVGSVSASIVDEALDVSNRVNQSRLGRMKISTSDVDANGNYSVWKNYGARSMSIFQVTASGITLVADTGSQFEAYTQNLYGYPYYNCDEGNTGAAGFDIRSDDKGPEPETVRIGLLGDEPYAFVSLERVGGIMMYSLTNVAAPTFHTYYNNRNFTEPNLYAAGDLSPEGMIFVPQSQSPTGEAMLLVTGTFSGTVSAYFIRCIADCPSAAFTLLASPINFLVLVVLIMTFSF